MNMSKRTWRVWAQQIIIAKNRYGTTCKFDVGYHGDSASILDTPEQAKQKFDTK